MTSAARQFICDVQGGVISTIRRQDIANHISTLKDGPCRIEVDRFDPDSTEQQRRYWRGPVCNTYSGYSGYSVEESHAVLMWELLPSRRETITMPDGSMMLRRVSWTELRKAEASNLIEAAHRLLNDNGVYIPTYAEWQESK